MYSTNIRRQVNRTAVHPVPTRSTRILFDATEPHPAQRNFGQGVLRAIPHYRMPMTAADLAWWMTESNQVASESLWEPDDVIDQRAYEAACVERLQRGHCL